MKEDTSPFDGFNNNYLSQILGYNFVARIFFGMEYPTYTLNVQRHKVKFISW